jgi:2Fe-2S ferredoxin
MRVAMAKTRKFMTFLPGPCDVPLSHNPEHTILDLALKAKIDMDHTCGGNGTCGTCMVYVEKGLEEFGERNDIEAEFAQERGLAPHERLSCQNYPHEGLVVTVPRKTRLYK